ncbi:hypothetical protein [uncultured Jannaschia sp.]|uniref:hypothetical protein n=1 Tax=uncultured Jannaschia sp. TaxID=293347 RepID=UPI0026236200|nr:hypothetical protein [uncultured Jannaschia sp.]
MPTITITNYDKSPLRVSDAFFGGNVLYQPNTDAATGRPLENFEAAVSALGQTILRYPAGQTEVLFADGMVAGGDMIPQVRGFLEWARSSGVEGVVLVLPTEGGYHGRAELRTFVEKVMGEFGDLIAAFEIGNEYWRHDPNPGGESRETEYAGTANQIAKVVGSVLETSDHDPDILVQTANPAGQGSSYNWRHADGLGTNMTEAKRWELANADLQDALSDDALAHIDGIVHHFYWQGGHDSGNSRDYRMTWHEESWSAVLGRDMAFYVTEWNVQKDHVELLGLRSAGAILEMVEGMVRAGVDTALVWPPQHNTRNDLAGGAGADPIVDPVSGYVVNSIGGAVFDVMSDALSDGASLLNLSMKGASDTRMDDTDFLTYGYSDDNSFIFYIASLSGETKTARLDVSNVISGGYEASAVRIGMNRETSDGQRSTGAGEANFVMVDGARYHYDEDDVQAEIDLLSQANIARGYGEFAVKLDPYEAVQITIELDGVLPYLSGFICPTPLLDF